MNGVRKEGRKGGIIVNREICVGCSNGEVGSIVDKSGMIGKSGRVVRWIGT